MSEGMTAQERADKVGCMIAAEVNSGRFSLDSGYVCGAAPYVKSGRAEPGTECMGCAIGSLAYALGMRAHGDGGGRSGGECRDYVAERAGGLISMQEQFQLEMGYEAWTNMGIPVADPDSPFFQLGMKMSLKAGHCSQRMFDNLLLHLAARKEHLKRIGK